ncbi:MAG: hypothetical protein WAO41_06630 [Candidatus Nanopelagicales bacterium]
MTRVAAAAAFGALAGSLSAFSHAVGGGTLSMFHLAAISIVSAGVFVLLHRWMRAPVVLVSALLGLQLGAHVWLEMAHPHAHMAASNAAGHAYGLDGAIAHALTPGMMMMWAHFAAVIAGVALYSVTRPLMNFLAYAVTRLRSPRLVPVAMRLVRVPVFIGGLPQSLRGLTYSTPRRGPPVLA